MNSFDIRSSIYNIPGQNISNALGIAVNPANNNIFITTLSYGGEPNLWQFSSDGTLIDSVRVNFSGSLGSAVIGRDSHLFICATKEKVSGGWEHYIIKVSQDGQEVSELFLSDDYTRGGDGIAYNVENNHLFVSSHADKKVYEVSLDGSLLNSFDVINSPYDIAFDPFTKNILIISEKNIMDEYAENIMGSYSPIMSYALNSVGISESKLALDIDKSSGLFYAQVHNNHVLEFNRSELQPVQIAHLFGYVEL